MHECMNGAMAMRQCAVGVEGAVRSMEEGRGRGVGTRVTRGRRAGGRVVTMTTVMTMVTTLMVMTRASPTMAVVRAREDGDDPSSDGKSVHTVFSTECTAYFDWQSLGLYDSWRRVGQRGKFTRLMACDDARPKGLDIVPDTHVHPNYATHPVSKDRYSAYNKPFSIALVGARRRRGGFHHSFGRGYDF